VGCHEKGSADTCPGGSECNVVDGGAGVCLGLVESDAGTPTTQTCSNDPECAAGLVCDQGLVGGAECVVGCHAQGDGGADTCEIATHCSAIGGGLGVCLNDTASGTHTANSSCSADTDCVEGLVCDRSLDGGAECVFGCHANGAGSDTCPSGAHCSNVGGGVGVCLENGTPGEGSSSDASTSSSSSGGGGHGQDSGAGDGSAGSSSGSSGGGSGSGSDSGGGAGSDGSVAGDAGGEGEGDSGGDAQSGMLADGSTAVDATIDGAGSGDGASGADSGANDGYMEGAGCACSSAPGAGAMSDGLLFSAAWAIIGAAIVGRSRGRTARRNKKDGRPAR
jgi:hypothetical protein